MSENIEKLEGIISDLNNYVGHLLRRLEKLLEEMKEAEE